MGKGREGGKLGGVNSQRLWGEGMSDQVLGQGEAGDEGMRNARGTMTMKGGCGSRVNPPPIRARKGVFLHGVQGAWVYDNFL